MGKKMLINATHPEENRVAIVEDGILTELDIEIAGKEQSRGNVYKAVVVRVEPGLQAAFVDYGGERFGFLQMGEIHPSYFRNGDGDGETRRQRITDVLRRGQELLVQVVKEERGTKGAALTTFLSLPGRYMVLMPDSDTKGVSRKIEDESQRKKLKEAMASLDLPQHMGYIVRTAGIGQKKEELKRDFDYLVRVWEKIRDEAGRTRAPALIYKESNLVIRSIRDYFTSEMDEVLVDDPRTCEEAKDFFQQVMPEYARLVKLHQEKRPIFARYQIEEQIETISKNKVPLPSGGSIVIDATEALVAVDVNSGKMAGESNVETTAFKTNLEAAVETARQLRLRDLGGLIVIDFIDMRDRKHIREIEKALKDSLKYDKARVTVGRISQFGLLEMSRQRIKAALAEGSFLPCPHCGGGGRIKSPEAQAIAFLRKVHAAVAKGQVGRIEGEVPLEVATYLLNTKREELVDMERRHQMTIVIKGRPDFVAGQAEISAQKREKEDFPTLDVPTLTALPVLPSADPPARVRGAKSAVERKPEAAAGEAAPAEQGSPPVHPPAEPVEATEETEAADLSGDAEASTAEDAGKKKRKRRRKKKKAGEEVAVEELSEISPPAEPETSAESGMSEPVEAEALAEGAAAAGEGSEKRKRKRRRKKKKSGETLASAEAMVEEEAAFALPLPDESEGAGADAGDEPGREAEERRKKRRRRRKKKGAAPAEGGDLAAAEASAELDVPAAPATLPAETEVPQPRNRRGRKTAAEPAPEPLGADTTEMLPAPAAAEAAPAKKTRAKRRGKAAESTEALGAAPAGAASVPEPRPIDAPGAEGTEPAPATGAKTARKPRRRAAPAAEPETAAAGQAMERPEKQMPPAAAGSADSETKPKRRPPRKKGPTDNTGGDGTTP